MLLLAFGGIVAAALGAIGVAVSGGPHLSFHDLDPWLVVYAIGLLVTLGLIGGFAPASPTITWAPTATSCSRFASGWSCP